jgi:choice-of-anchor B domain-containing protein
MKKILFALFLVLFALASQAQLNITYQSSLPYPGKSLANIGGHVDSQGNEYALVGTFTGLSIVNVSNPAAPVEKFDVTGPSSSWREVKTWGNYAYVTTEGGSSGLQIINMTYLPDSIQVKFWKGSGSIANQLETIHALHIEDAHVYLFGSNIANGGPVIASLADPWNPVYVGQKSGSYVHDGYVRNDTLWAAHIYGGYFSVMDVSTKSNPVILAQQSTPGNFTHNTWLNDAGSVLFTTDEINNSFLTAYDVRDINNITEIARVKSQHPTSGSAVHNTHIINDFAVTSWYKDGVVIHDVARPDNPVLVGWYDTSPLSGSGFDGCWGVYPYLPSGNLVASDMQQGLFVLTPNYVRGAYLEGIVTDSTTSIPLNNVLVEIQSTSVAVNTKLTGVYKTGLAASGTYTVTFTRSGYFTKIFNNVSLSNGVLTQLDVELVPLSPPIVLTGQVVDAVTSAPVSNAQIQITNTAENYIFNTNSAGEFTINNFLPNNYDVIAGQWGYITECFNQAVTGPLTITLQPGIYDDFSFDFGWTESGTAATGAWERGVPVGTTNQGTPSNPGSDVNSDCGNQAYVTGNGGGAAGNDDVDDGYTILTSPVFDVSNMIEPHVKYYRWFYNAGGFGTPNDSLIVSISNGTSTAVMEIVTATTPGNSTWVPKDFKISDFVTPSATMTISFYTADLPPTGHLVEAGVDQFRVTEMGVGIEENNSGNSFISIYPNPSNDDIYISYKLNNRITQKAFVEIISVTGQLISRQQIFNTEGNIKANRLKAGIYFGRVINGSEKSDPVKIVITEQ